MLGDLDLFGEDASKASGSSLPDPEPAPDVATGWQIELLRSALDRRGLNRMEDRQQLIEKMVGHPVASLRSLTQGEALAILNRLGPTSRVKRSESAWDDRDEETWIDKL